MSLVERMKRARLERDMTEAQLAQALRVRQSAVSMVESGELEVSQELAKNIEAWIASGKGAPKTKRGPYQKRRTLP